MLSVGFSRLMQPLGDKIKLKKLIKIYAIYFINAVALINLPIKIQNEQYGMLIIALLIATICTFLCIVDNFREWFFDYVKKEARGVILIMERLLTNR
jgi:hypothetical protein